MIYTTVKCQSKLKVFDPQGSQPKVILHADTIEKFLI